MYQSYSADYHKDVSLAQAGIQHLRNAQKLLEGMTQKALDVSVVDQARAELSAAATAFDQLDLELRALPALSGSIPVYGVRLKAAMHLAPMAAGLSEAGIAACNVLEVFLAKSHDTLSAHGTGLTPGDMTIIQQNFQASSAALDRAIAEASQVQPGALQFDPHIASMFTLFQREIPTIQAWLGTIGKLIDVMPMLLGVGAPAHYLVELLDSTELRPAGGFIGNYGIATLTGGRLTSAHIMDVLLIDKPHGVASALIPYPPAYSWFSHYLSPAGWSLRDSNLDADFPTAAGYAEQNYAREGGKDPLQGVIAITPVFIERMLEMTGPIYIPEYNETVTAQNLIDRIHFHQLGRAGEGSSFIASPDGHSSERKRFTGLLAEHFLARTQQLAPSILPRLLPLLANSLRSKDVQVYFNAMGAEDILQRLHLATAIQAPAGDSFLQVDANVSPNKANHFITDTMHDQVSIDEEGTVTHHLSIEYAWTSVGSVYGTGLYRDYVRVYVPPGSTLLSQNGWQPHGTSEAFGREVWAGFFTFSYGLTHTITLQWTVPHAAVRDGRGWQYHYLVQRQAGVQWQLHLQVGLPACATALKTAGAAFTSSGQSVMLTTYLDEDLNLDVAYAC
ncbi:MAG: DUF4012 domain-containing protein [Chloroflexota bacterium]|nr:DUF4012 domain-containing protein [Chloroflexota bacterium]